MKSSTFILASAVVMSISNTGFAKNRGSFCFQKHILESISINKARQEVYSKLTDGKSHPIYRELIAYERLSLTVATFFDLKALRYQKAGINIFCKEFKDLIQAPSLLNSKPLEAFSAVSTKPIEQKISAALKTKNTEEVKKASLEILEELKTQPSYYCLSRHFIESIYRFAHFAPMWSKQAQEKGLKDPSKMIFNVMKLHALGLKGTFAIDRKSQPIQAKGIPMLCAEIPDLLEDIHF
jgi:hypothetical protein